jgi:hypothetical protein
MRSRSACYKLKMGLYVEFGWEMAVWERKEKKYNKKKPLIREGPNSSSIPELIVNLTKNPDVSFVVIYFYQNPKEVLRFENGEITLERMRFLQFKA